MKIVLVHNFYQQPGGEDIVFEQERSLLERKGHQVLTYTRSNSELVDSTLPQQLHVIKNMIWSSDSRDDLRNLLRRVQPDLVHVHNTFLTISSSIYDVCKDAGIPTVQTLHNFRLLCPVSTLCRDGKVCRDCIDISLLEGVRHACYHSSRAKTSAVAMMMAFHRMRGTWTKDVSAFIALTNFAKKLFVDSGLPAEKIHVKPNFVEPDPGQCSEPGNYACFLGRLSPEKGVSTLLTAWKLLPFSLPLKIIGDGPSRKEHEAQARSLGLNHVEFLGHLSRRDAHVHLKGARFMVMPSLWYEGFAVVLVESFACGVPIIASRLGAMQELIDDGNTGLHFTVGDPVDLARKVEWAWKHPGQVAAMGNNARQEYLDKYTADTNYKMLLDVYGRVIGRSPIEAGLVEESSSLLHLSH